MWLYIILMCISCFIFFANDLLLALYFSIILDYENDVRQKANLSDFLIRVQTGGSILKLLLNSASELVVTDCCMKSTFHCTSRSYQEMVHCCVEKEKTTLQNNNILIFSLAYKSPSY